MLSLVWCSDPEPLVLQCRTSLGLLRNISLHAQNPQSCISAGVSLLITEVRYDCKQLHRTETHTDHTNRGSLSHNAGQKSRFFGKISEQEILQSTPNNIQNSFIPEIWNIQNETRVKCEFLSFFSIYWAKKNQNKKKRTDNMSDE